jgi:hypothetical protein
LSILDKYELLSKNLLAYYQKEEETLAWLHKEGVGWQGLFTEIAVVCN